MMEEADDDGGGTISFPEFLALMSKSSAKKDPKQDITDAYAMFDKDSKGQITLQDLQNAAQELRETMSDDQLQVRLNRGGLRSVYS